MNHCSATSPQWSGISPVLQVVALAPALLALPARSVPPGMQ